ncbi:uncharacterized protein LOC119701111 isoform X2 [Motacilla alba alba]|uniref:uncharacterized protein LOC119701111 isoform X2 n=1 Tax=Motacilla alba alba TaxID=1094192 RepID=UPI0018D519BE|nr:uncharacterized protein LOC119701111 isoform X2 [Motacilla alba alba]
MHSRNHSYRSSWGVTCACSKPPGDSKQKISSRKPVPVSQLDIIMQCTRAHALISTCTEEHIYATEHFPGSSGIVAGGAQMNEKSYPTVQRSEPTITLMSTFTEDILQYIKSRCRHNVSEEEKKQSITILSLALWCQPGPVWRYLGIGYQNISPEDRVEHYWGLRLVGCDESCGVGRTDHKKDLEEDLFPHNLLSPISHQHIVPLN